jgi:DNA-binding transcriptional LysR family regulator
VLPPHEFAVWRYLIEAYRAEGVEPPRITVGTLSLPANQHLLATGRFLTMLPASMLQFGAKQLSIKALPLKSPVKPSAVAVLTLKSRRPELAHGSHPHFICFMSMNRRRDGPQRLRRSGLRVNLC